MKGCGLLQCQEDVGAGRHLEIFTMCLPMHTGSKERKRRCEAVNSTYRIHDRWDNCSSQTETTPDHTMLWIVLTTIPSTFLVYFIAIVVYYRVRYQKDGTAPFVVPDGCPVSLFPRAQHEDQSHQLRVFR